MKQYHSSFIFFFISLQHYFIFLKEEKGEHISLCIFWENKGITLQTLRGKQKFQVTNVGVEEIKLSRLQVQRMNEIQRKTPQ